MITYRNKTEIEVLWNSRDNGVPQMIESATTGEILHVAEIGMRVVDHVPNVGERILVDLTEARKYALATRIFESQELTNHEDLRRRFPTREAAFDDLLNYLETNREQMSDVLVVTSGYLEAARESRTLEAAEDQDEKYFDRNLKPITNEELLRLAMDERYRVVAFNQLGKNKFVKTIWLGHDPYLTALDKRRPEIFESMVYFSDGPGDVREIECQNYCTEEEALARHLELVNMVKTEMEFSEVLDKAKVPSSQLEEVMLRMAKRAGLKLALPNPLDKMLERLESVAIIDTTVEEDHADRKTTFERVTGRKVNEVHVTCPACGDEHKVATVTTSMDKGAAPRTGDFAICINCGSISRYTEAKQLEPLSPDDKQHVTPDMKRISKLVRERGRIRRKN